MQLNIDATRMSQAFAGNGAIQQSVMGEVNAFVQRYRGAGLAVVWPSCLALTLIGSVLFALSLACFRKTNWTIGLSRPCVVEPIVIRI